MEIYFDNSATTRPYDEVASAVFDTMTVSYTHLTLPPN
mgnify:CR=1 FL=1